MLLNRLKHASLVSRFKLEALKALYVHNSLIHFVNRYTSATKVSLYPPDFCRHIGTVYRSKKLVLFKSVLISGLSLYRVSLYRDFTVWNFYTCLMRYVADIYDPLYRYIWIYYKHIADFFHLHMNYDNMYKAKKK